MGKPGQEKEKKVYTPTKPDKKIVDNGFYLFDDDEILEARNYKETTGKKPVSRPKKLKTYIPYVDYPDEFANPAHIPERLINGGTIKELEEFLFKTKELDENDRLYLRTRIQTEQFYVNFERNKQKTEAQGPIVNNNGDIILNHIHQDKGQRTGNGCYSCSFLLLLQSRGVNLTQEQIRGYREKGDFASPTARNRMLNDNQGNVIDIGGIVTKGLPNTAIHEKAYQIGDSAQDRQNAAEAIRATVLHALMDLKSPVSLLQAGHYVTIVGYNPEKDTFIIKNSMFHSTPNKNDERTMTELLDVGVATLTYLQDIDPENPMNDLDDVYGLEYVNGTYVQNVDRSLKFTPSAYDPEGISANTNTVLGSPFTYESHIVKLPNQLVPTLRMQEPGYTSPTVKPLAESPEKQNLMVELNRRMQEIIPPQGKLVVQADGPVNERGEGYTFTVEYPGEDGQMLSKAITKRQLAEYYQYNRIKDNINQLTPWQTAHVLTQKTLEDNLDFLLHESEPFRDLMVDIHNKRISPESLTDGAAIIVGENAEIIEPVINEAPPQKQEQFIDIKQEEPAKEEIKKEEPKAPEKKEEPEKEEPAKEEAKKEETKAPEKKVKTLKEIRNEMKLSNKEFAFGKKAKKPTSKLTNMLLNESDISKPETKAPEKKEEPNKEKNIIVEVPEIEENPTIIERTGEPEKTEQPKKEESFEETLARIKNEYKDMDPNDLLAFKKVFQKELQNREITEEDGIRMLAIDENLIAKGIESSIEYDANEASKETEKKTVENKASGRDIQAIMKNAEKELQKAMKDRKISAIARGLVKNFYLESLEMNMDKITEGEFKKYTDEKYLNNFAKKNENQVKATLSKMSKDKDFREKFKEAAKSGDPVKLKHIMSEFTKKENVRKAGSKKTEKENPELKKDDFTVLK